MDEPTSGAPGFDPVVAVLRWPAERERRLHLAARRIPRLLLLAADDEPPAPIDDLEDWLRAPISPADLATRSESVQRRAEQQRSVPVLDQDGLLRHRGRWVAIPDAQLPVVELLVSRIGELVRREEIAAAYAAGGGTANGNTVSTVLFRLRHRFDEVGLSLQIIRRRGVMVELQP